MGGLAHLVVTIRLAPSRWTELTYTLVVSNAGSIAAPGVVLTDTLPAGAVFVSASPPPASQSPLVWNAGTLVSNQALTYTVVVTVTSNVTGSLVNTAQLATLAPAGSATSTVTTSVTAAADLSLDKTVSSVASGAS
jgi:uncharacterized repeat protein (TIGR01451 family)